MECVECKVGTIRQIHRRLIREGYQISECALRRWVKDGTLPAIRTGNKALISYDRVLEVLKGAPVTAILSPITI